MLNFCDFIQVYVFTTNHHLKLMDDLATVIAQIFYVNPYNQRILLYAFLSVYFLLIGYIFLSNQKNVKASDRKRLCSVFVLLCPRYGWPLTHAFSLATPLLEIVLFEDKGIQ